MNLLCFVCESPATRVCKYKTCSSPPFYCSGPCTKGISQKLHTHQNKKDFISIQQYQQKLAEIKKLLDPHSTYKQYFEDVKKKVNRTKDHLQQQINHLYKALEQLERDVCQELCFKLAAQDQSIMKKIDNNFDGDSINGGHMNKLFNGQLHFINEEKIKIAAQQIKESFEEQLSKLLQLKFEPLFMSYQQRIKKSSALHAVLNKSKSFWSSDGDKLKQILEINRFDYSIHQTVVQFLIYSRLPLEQHQSFKYCLQLNPNHFQFYYKVGQLFEQRKQIQKALVYYSKALEIDKTSLIVLKSRGACLVKLNRYKEAIADYTKAMQYQQNTDEVNKRIQEIFNLMKNQKVDQPKE